MKLQKKDIEIEQMKLKYEALQKQHNLNEKAITALQQRDAKLFRLAFNADPIDPSVYYGGTGGSDKYANLANFSSTKTIVETQDNGRALEPLNSVTISLIRYYSSFGERKRKNAFVDTEYQTSAG